jgi:hypothetical protein
LRVKGTRIYAATSDDGGKTWSANRLVYESPTGSVCQCCHPSVAIGARGELAIMFRNEMRSAPSTGSTSDASPLPMRDMYLARAPHGGSFAPAAKLGRQSWPLAGCPMDGGDIAFDARGELITIWRRDKEIFLAKPGEPERSLGPGQNPALAASRTGTYGAWTTADGLVVRDIAGRPIATTVPDARFPVLLSAGDNGAIVLAYERDGRAFVRVLDAVPASARR